MANPRVVHWGRELVIRHRGMLFLLQAVVLLGLGYWLASVGRTTRQPVPATPARTQDATPDAGPTTWTCSMHPQIRQSKPGQCPICGMPLIPVAKTAGGMRTLSVSPEARALMNIATSPVERKYVAHEIRLVGKVDYDETKLGYITAWVAGRLDRLFVDYTGVQVNKGDHMVYIYSEDLYAAQQELIQAARFARERGRPTGIGGVNLVEAAREKLALLGLTDAQIVAIESQSEPSDHLTIYAPVNGVVIEKLKQEGERVKVGDRIYTIADLSLVWVHLDAYESDLPWIRYGQDVVITTEAYPGEEFHGRIAFIQPVLNDKTRTVKVRVNVPNTEGKLKPEMFVHATVRPKIAAGGRVIEPSFAGKWICPMHPEVVKDELAECDICGMDLVRAETLGYVTPETDQREPPLVIPYSAVLPTGTRAVVYVELPNSDPLGQPTFEGREIVLGPRAGDYQLVRHGLTEGELVVTQGNFKIDAEVQIQAKPSMMTPEGGGGSEHAHGEQAGRTAALPSAFREQARKLFANYEAIGAAVKDADLADTSAAFDAFGKTLDAVDGNSLTGHARMVWKEFAMLLGNDAVEGRDAREMEEVNRVYRLLKIHMQRLREQLDIPLPQPSTPQ